MSRWWKLVAGLVAIIATSYVGCAHAESVTAVSIATQFADGTKIPAGTVVTYTWLEGPCGSKPTNVLQTGPSERLFHTFAPGCHTVNVTMSANGKATVAAAPLSFTIRVPALPTQVTVQ